MRLCFRRVALIWRTLICGGDGRKEEVLELVDWVQGSGPEEPHVHSHTRAHQPPASRHRLRLVRDLGT